MNDPLACTSPSAAAPAREVMTTAHALHFVFAYRLTGAGHPADGKAPTLAEQAQRYVQRRLAPAAADDGPDAAAFVAATLGKQPVWQEIGREKARGQLSADLTPVSDRLLHGGEPQAVNGAHRPATAPYTGFAPLALSNAFGNARFLIDWTAAARRRLAAAGVAAELVERTGVCCAGGRLYGFASGFVLLVLELRVLDLGKEAAALPAALIEETLYALATPSGRKTPPLLPVRAEWHACPQPLAAGTRTVVDPALGHAVRAASADEAAAPRVQPLQHARALLRAVAASATPQERVLTLHAAVPAGALDPGALAAVCAGAGHDVQPTALTGTCDYRRVFTYAAVQCAADTDPAALDLLAWRLGQRFTRDYQAAMTERHGPVLHTFANIVHAASTQGGAVVVGESEATFLQGFVAGPARNVYLPLALLAHHEYLLLLHHTQDCAFLPDAANPQHDLERIQALRAALAEFRLYFRYAHVSDMGHHNAVHRHWRAALDLDRMLAELALDVREADQVLERHHREHQEHRWRIVGAGTAVLGGFVLVHELLEAFLPLLHPPLQGLLLALKGDGRDWPALEHDAALHAAVDFMHRLHASELWMALGALAAAAVFGIVAWKRGPKLEE